jgi:multiple sugar transport system ATP-binding protein
MSGATRNGSQVMVTGEPAIELVGMTKRYGDRLVVDCIDLTIERGEFLVLLGPSGCGKSTILKILAGLEEASGGDVLIDGRLVNYVAPKARDVAMVFQNYALYPHMTVAQNIGFPLKMRGQSKTEVAARVREVAEMLDLTGHTANYPEQLSGGQRQRVALGRAIIRDPVAFLMDEPLSNLDALLRVQMREELMRLHRQVGRTTVYVTHDQVEAMTMATRIVVLHDGVVQQVGTPEEVYLRPANTFVATFVGSPQMNLFPGVIEHAAGGARFAGAGIAIPLGRGVDYVGEATLGVRPADVELVDDAVPGAVPAIVGEVEYVGADLYVHTAVGDDDARLVVRAPVSIRPAVGEVVHINFDPEGMHLFQADGTRIRLDEDIKEEVRIT